MAKKKTRAKRAGKPKTAKKNKPVSFVEGWEFEGDWSKVAACIDEARPGLLQDAQEARARARTGIESVEQDPDPARRLRRASMAAARIAHLLDEFALSKTEIPIYDPASARFDLGNLVAYSASLDEWTRYADGLYRQAESDGTADAIARRSLAGPLFTFGEWSGPASRVALEFASARHSTMLFALGAALAQNTTNCHPPPYGESRPVPDEWLVLKPLELLARFQDGRRTIPSPADMARLGAELEREKWLASQDKWKGDPDDVLTDEEAAALLDVNVKTISRRRRDYGPKEVPSPIRRGDLEKVEATVLRRKGPDS